MLARSLHVSAAVRMCPPPWHDIRTLALRTYATYAISMAKRKLSRSEAAKKGWEKRYRKMGIIPPRVRARQLAAQSQPKKTREQLLDEAEAHMIAQLGAKPRFSSRNIRERLDSLTDRQLAGVPKLTLTQIIRRAKRKANPDTGFNAFWYGG